MGGYSRASGGLVWRIGRLGILLIDAMLRRSLGVYEFTQDEDCLLRIALTRSGREVTLSDGTRVQKGEPIGELHFWNEHIPPMSLAGPDFRWGVEFYRRLVHSLEKVAEYVQREPKFEEVRAFRGETIFNSASGLEQLAFWTGKQGLDLVRMGQPPGVLGRFARFWENAYTLSLMWAFNPGSLRGKGFSRLERCQVWISRASLVERYRGGDDQWSVLRLFPSRMRVFGS